MEILTKWQNYQAISSSEVEEIENNIKREVNDLLEGVAKPCHSGDAVMTLTIDNQFSKSVAGNIKCSCGKPLVLISGSTNSMSYQQANV